MILIVDDNADLATSLTRYLKYEGFTCEWASDGLAAIERLRREPVPALVLLDYRMPGADGLEVLRFIRSQPMTATVPVVMMSGDLKGCPDGAHTLLQKPFDLAVLLAELRRLRGHSSP